MEKSLMFLVACILALYVNAQDALDIGDEIPAELYSTLVSGGNEKNASGKNDEKILLLDFWTVTCQSCITGMPKLAELQKQYTKDLKIVLVTKNPEKLIEPFLFKRPYIKQLGLDMIIGDTVLNRFFPHSTMPHVVWIGKDRKVKAITFSGSSNSKTVDDLLADNKLDLLFKKDERWDYKEQILTSKRINKSRAFSYTTITESYFPGMTTSLIFSTPPGSLKLVGINLDFLALYFNAYILEFNLDLPRYWKYRALIKAKNLKDILIDSNGKQRNFCYETSIPIIPSEKNSRERIQNKSKEDLDNFFSCKSHIDSLPVKCYIVKLSGPKSSKRTETTYDLRTTTYYGVHPKIAVVAMTRLATIDKPVFFEGNEKDRIDIQLKNEYRNLEDLKSDLARGGLTVTEEVRTIPMLIFDDL